MASPSIGEVIDDKGDIKGPIKNGEATDDDTPTLIGSGTPGNIIIIKDGDEIIGSTVVGDDGKWEFTPEDPLAEGAHVITPIERDKDGNSSEPGEGFTVIVDLTPPETAQLSKVIDDVGPYTGELKNGDLTDDNTPTFTGTAEAGSTVEVWMDGRLIGTAIADAQKEWSFTPAEGVISDGEHEFTLVAVDKVGNRAEPSEPFKLIIDTDAPGRPGEGGIGGIELVYDDIEPRTGPVENNGYTNDDTPTYSGGSQTPNNLIIVYDNDVVIGSVKVDGNGNWAFTPEIPFKDGAHVVTIGVRDPAGNESLRSDPWTVIVDTSAPTKPGEGGTGGDGIGDIWDDMGPIQGKVARGESTDDNTPTLDGSGLQPGDIVTIIDNGQPIGSARVDENGGWRFTPDTRLNDGDHNFTVIVTDPAGNASVESDPYLIIIDTKEPNAPTIDSVIDDQGTVTGPINPGDVTDDAQPQISGTAEANSTVIIYDDGVEIGRATTNAAGAWVFTPVPPLLNGSHNLTAKAQDAAGNISVPSNEFGFELISGGNATAPSIIGAWDNIEGHVGMLHGGDLTNDSRPELRGSAQPNQVVTLSVDGVVVGSVTASSTGEWSWTPPVKLPDGTHNFVASVTDAAGNPSRTGDFRLDIDTTRPGAADDVTANDNVGPVVGLIPQDGTTDDSTPTFEGSGEAGDVVIIKDNGEVIGSTVVGDDGRWSFTPETRLADGPHSVVIVIEDPAGNSSDPSAPINFDVDTSAVIVSLDYAIDNEGSLTGNLSSGTVTDDTTPTLVGRASPNSVVEVFDNGVSLGSVRTNAQGNWSFTPKTELPEGSHHFTAVATNTAGTVSAPTASFNLDIDTTAPGKPGEGGTGGDGIGNVWDDVGPIQGNVGNGERTDDNIPTLDGSGLQPGDIVTIIDNGQPIGSARVDENGGWRFTPDTRLNDGDHNFTVIVTDPAGNASVESDPYLIIIDTKEPNAPTIDSVIDDQGTVTGPINPGDVTDDAQPQISGTAEANSTVIIYDDGVEIGRATTNAAGAWVFTPVPPLLNGSHNLTAKAQDAAGNISVPSNEFGFELISGGNATAPSIIGAWDNIEGHVGMLHGGDLTNDSRPELRGSAQPNQVVTLSVDGVVVGSVTASSTGEWSWTPPVKLPDGTHNFVASVTDTAGNPSRTGDFRLDIDTTRPGAADDVTANDNVGPVVGLIPQDGTTDDSTPTFEGSGEAGDVVIIKDNGEVIGSTVVGDDGRWSFTPETRLADGPHSVVIVIEDPAGNSSDPSAPINFDVDTSAVIVSLDYAIDNEGSLTGNLSSGTVTDDTTPTLVGRASPNSVVEVFDNGVSLGSVRTNAQGNWSFTPKTELPEGSHHFTAVATNTAGTVSAPTASFNLDIDTTAPGKPGEGGTGGDGIGNVWDDVGPIQGNVGNGERTDDNIPTLDGSGLQPGDIVTIIDNGQPIGSARVDENGGWRFTPDTRLNDGDHNFTVIVTDPAGNASVESDPYLIIIDTKEPNAPTIDSVIDDQGTVTGPINPGDVTDDAQPQISGTAEANSTVIIYDDGVEIGRATTNAAGAWVFTPVPPLLNGSHNLTAKAQDAAGNISVPSNEFGFELISGGNATAPSIIGAWDNIEGHVGMLHGGDLTNDSRPELRGSAQPNQVVTLSVDGVVVGSVTASSTGEWSWTPPVKLPDGTHNFVASVTDTAGNPSRTGDFRLDIDTTRPGAADDVTANDNVGPVVGLIPQDGTTDDSTPTFEGSGEAGDVVIIKDNGEVIGSTVVGDDGRWSFTPETRLADGPHSVVIVIEDPAGNSSDPSAPINFDVDTSAVIVSLDYAIDNEGSLTGNLSSGTVTDDTTPTLVGRASPNSVVEVFDNGVSLGSVRTNAQGNWSFTPKTELPEGSHHFTAVATNTAGTVSAPTASFNLDIDTTAPGKPGEGGTGGDGIGNVWDDVGPIQGNVGNGERTDDNIPTLDGSGLQPGDIVTIIDNGQPIGSARVDENGGWRFTPDTRLNDGDHNFTVIVTDPAGNASVESDPYLIIIDTKEPNAPTIDSVIDDMGTVTGDIANGGRTDDTTPTLNGTAEAGSIVRIYNGTTLLGSVQANASTGAWSYTPTALTNGTTYNFQVNATDAAGNTSGYSGSRAVTIDTTPPGAPVITSVMDNEGTVTGDIANGGTTDDTTPTLNGTAEANSIVRVYNGTTLLGSVQASGTGAWSYTPTALTNGTTYTFRVDATDAAGNTSGYSGSRTITIDTAPPGAPVITSVMDNEGTVTGDIANGGTTDDTTPTLNGTAEAGSIVRVYNGTTLLGSVQASGTGAWSYTPTALTNGTTYTFRVDATDAAGNTSGYSASRTITIDTAPPGAPVITSVMDNEGTVTGDIANGGTTDDTTPTLNGTAEANSIVRVYNGTTLLGSVQASGTGAWSYTPTALTNGTTYTFRVDATDAAGNTSGYSGSRAVTIDTTPPGAPVITSVMDNMGTVTGDIANGGTTDDTTPTLNGTAEANSIVRVYNGTTLLGSVQASGTGAWSYTPTALTNGTTYTFRVDATDAAGNTSGYSGSRAVTIDTTPPGAPVITSVMDNMGTVTGDIANGGTTDDTTPTLNGTAEANSIVRVYNGTTLLGSVQASGTGAWSYTPTALTNGTTYTFRVDATDAAGNTSGYSGSRAVTIDTTPPGAPVITSVMDNMGTVTGDIANGGRTDDTTPTLNGTAEANSIVRVYNGTTLLGSVQASGTGAWSYTPTALTNGTTYTFRVDATDAAGNTSGYSGSRAVTIDTTPPGAPVITSVMDNMGTVTGDIANGGRTDDTTPTLNGTAEANSIVRVYNGTTLLGSVQASGTGAWSYTPTALTNGTTYTFRVDATDAAGNTSGYSGSRAVTIDTTPPGAPVITSVMDNMGTVTGDIANGGRTDDTTPTLNGTAEANSIVRVYNGTTLLGSVQASGTGAWSYTPTALTNGTTYTFRVDATDAAGNTSGYSGSRAVTIDTTPPGAPVITSVMDNMGTVTGDIANGGRTDDTTPTLNGTAEANSIVRVYNGTTLLGSVQASGTGAWSYTPTALTNGTTYTFRVDATDAAGNTSGYSGSRAVTIDTTPPGAPVITSVMDNMGTVTGDIANGGNTDDTTPTLNGTAEAGSIVRITVDGGTVYSVTATGGNWTWTPPAGLALGNHSFSVTATDAAGNTSAATSRSVVIVAPSTSGSENFNSFTTGGLYSGNTPLPSGLTVLANQYSVYQVTTGNMAVNIGGGINFTVGGTTDITFDLSGYGTTVGNPARPAYVTYYDTDNNVLIQQVGTGPINGSYTFKYEAPAGKLIGRIEIQTDDPSGLGLDNIVWGKNSISNLSIDTANDTSTLEGNEANVMGAVEDEPEPKPESEPEVDNEHSTLYLSGTEQPIDLGQLTNGDNIVSQVSMVNSEDNVLNLTLEDVLSLGEMNAFIQDGTKQMMIQGDEGDVVNLDDQLNGTDPSEWAKAAEAVEVAGVRYEVFQHSASNVELLVQEGVTTNLT
ncbi:hypothetical protein HKW95_19800 [Pseudomonas chlororaphis subsp. aurantiaca]